MLIKRCAGRRTGRAGAPVTATSAIDRRAPGQRAAARDLRSINPS